MKHKVRKPSISLDELEVQIALGTLKDAYQIAGFVAVTRDAKALTWASTHSSSKVREAAVKNTHCSLGILLKLGLCDKSEGVRDAARGALTIRSDEFKALLFVVEEYPQLALPFYHTAKVKTIEEYPALPGSDEDDE